MTRTEERLRSALDEVAGRVDPGPDRSFDGVPLERTRRWPILVAAATLALLVGVGIAVWTQHEDRETPVAAVNGPKTVLTARLDGTYFVDLQLLDGADRCVRIRYSEGDDYGRHPQVCSGGKPIAIEEAVRGGETRRFTIVYGVATHAERVHMKLIGGVTGHVEQHDDGNDVLFIAVINDGAASGTIWSTDGDRQVASASFDHGGPARGDKQFLQNGELIDFTFSRGGAIWALTTTGREIRLTDGTVNNTDGGGTVAPDGRTVIFSRENQTNYWAEVALDALSGEEREIDTFGSFAFSPDGTRVAGAYPIDDEEPINIGILDVPSFANRRTSTVPSTANGYLTVGWDTDGKHLLARGFPSGEMWWIDASTLAPSALALAGPTTDRIDFTNADSPGRFAALIQGTHEFGFFEVRGSSVSFTQVRTLRLKSELPSLSTRRDGSLLVRDDGDLYALTAEGEMTLLVRDESFVSRP